jgi:hypothetical protein
MVFDETGGADLVEGFMKETFTAVYAIVLSYE